MAATLMDIALDLIPDRWGMTANEKNVLVQLGKRADSETDDSDVGLPYVARRTGLSVDTVRRCVRALTEGGWVAVVPQDRPNGATSTNRYVLNYDQIVNAGTVQRGEEDEYRAKWRDRFATPPSTVQGGAGSTVQGGPLQPARGKLPDNNSSNSLSDAQARDAFEVQVKEAAGDAIDETAPGIIALYPLLVLLKDANPCLEIEVIEGVRKAAAWFRKRGLTGKMRNWETAVRMALEHRDARLRGHPVKEPERPAAESLGDPSGFDRERWRQVINVANLKRIWMGDEWGPPPGEDGCLVPRDLWSLWKGKAT